MAGPKGSLLVTGGAGYIGSHVCKALSAAGFTPVTYDSLCAGSTDAVRWGPLIVGDIRNPDILAAAFEAHRPVAVMNFAGLAAAGESVQHPDIFFGANICGFVSLLEAMKKSGCDRLVYSSPAAVCGDGLETPIGEAHRKAHRDPDAFSKLYSERLIADFGRAFGLQSISLRYFNAGGADPEGEIGETHDPETHLIPLALRAAHDPDFTLTVFGDDYDTPDGSAVRDYIHVTDIADAHVRALNLLLAGDPVPTGANALDIGTGSGFSVLEIVDRVAIAVGAPVKTGFGQRRAGDPSSLVADPRHARKILGWTPYLSDIDTVIRTAATWESRRLGILRGSAPRPSRRLLGVVEPASVLLDLESAKAGVSSGLLN